jgi:hypothetical protein
MPSTRRQRQQAEIRAEAERGNVLRARDLAREHLCEFPDDAVVLDLVADDSR